MFPPPGQIETIEGISPWISWAQREYHCCECDAAAAGLVFMMPEGCARFRRRKAVQLQSGVIGARETPASQAAGRHNE
jgi:hypothetical protein